MGVVYQVRHETRYRYGATVDVAAHMLHLLPRALPWQRVLSSAIITDPPVERCVDGRDHFGNQVTWLFMHRPHADFTVTLEARVVVSAGLAPVDAGPAWEDVAALMRARAAWREAEFVFASQHAPADRAAAAWASLDFPPGRPILEGLRALNRRFSDEFRFRPGVTEVNTPVAEVLRRREGVCQDFSHLMIAALRGLGLPARYVSGYVRTRPPPGQPARRGPEPCLGGGLGRAVAGLDRAGSDQRDRGARGACAARLGAGFFRRVAGARGDSGRRRAWGAGVGRSCASGK